MGLFGKSKAEKERERKQNEWEAHKKEQEKQRETDYQILAQAMERVEKLSPKWEIRIDKDLLAKTRKYTSGLNCSASYKSPEGISLYLRNSKAFRSADARGSGGGLPEFCQLRVSQETTTIYDSTFSSGPYHGAKNNRKAWELLDDYMRRLVEPLIQEKNRAKEEQETRGQAAKDHFWNS
jgi:hypothetical protein